MGMTIFGISTFSKMNDRRLEIRGARGGGGWSKAERVGWRRETREGNLTSKLDFIRIGTSLRVGGPREVHVERYVEVLQDSDSGLTYPALVGTRKESVEDVERLFGESLIQFMEQKNYTVEAKYLCTICNWRWAIDERGLCETQRQQFQQGFARFYTGWSYAMA